MLLQFLLCVATMSTPRPVLAAKPGRDVGLRLLQAQLPANASLRRLDCEQLARAVRAATLAHRKEVVPILLAALSLDEWDVRRKQELRLSCVCVVHLFHTAAAAAPERTSTLLETAEALFPECADGLTASLRGLQREVALNATATTDGADGSGQDGPGGPGSNGTVGPGPLGEMAFNGESLGDGGIGDGFGFGAGFGPGFPGSPGFGGSSGGSTGGGFTLPSPVGGAVTPAVNN